MTRGSNINYEGWSDTKRFIGDCLPLLYYHSLNYRGIFNSTIKLECYVAPHRSVDDTIDTVAWRQRERCRAQSSLTFLSVSERNPLMMMFPLVCLLCLSLTVPSLWLTYRLIRNKLFGSVFNLHSVLMFLLTAIKTPLSVAVKMTLMTGAEHFFEFSCIVMPVLEWIWAGSMLIGTFYALLFKY